VIPPDELPESLDLATLHVQIHPTDDSVIGP
jgi:hypothetical protein